MGLHDCQAPLDERPIDDTDWTCPVCGDIWDVVPTEPTNPAPRYTFYADRPGGYAGPTHARWVRRGADA